MNDLTNQHLQVNRLFDNYTITVNILCILFEHIVTIHIT
jgi:hypothetical protein